MVSHAQDGIAILVRDSHNANAAGSVVVQWIFLIEERDRRVSDRQVENLRTAIK